MKTQNEGCGTRLGLVRGLSGLFTLGLSLVAAPDALAAQELGKITPEDGARSDRFGSSVLLSGEDLFVGAPRRANKGAVYAYLGDISGNTAPVVFEPETGTGSYFGASLLRQGNELFIGVQRAEKPPVVEEKEVVVDGVPTVQEEVLAPAVFEAGAIQVYSKDEAGSWNLSQTLHAKEALVSDFFSESMAVSGDLLVVGASRRDADAATRDSGAVFVFERAEDGTWTEDQVLTPPVLTATGRFGYQVATNGQQIVVSMIGHDILVPGPEEDDPLVVGTRDAGIVYVYERDQNGDWVKVQDILAPNPQEVAAFGSAVELRGGRLHVSAPSDNVGGLLSGSVYTLEQGEEGWTHVQRIDPPVPEDGMLFGLDLSVSPAGRFMAVGAAGASNKLTSGGEILVYEVQAGRGWKSEPVEKLVTSDLARRDYVGSAVSILDDGTTVAGVRNDDDNGSSSGSVYRFGSFAFAPVAPFGVLALGAAGLLVLGRRQQKRA